jgi:beta-glucosidase
LPRHHLLRGELGAAYIKGRPVRHAIVEAWLPGSRGIGVADALFGDVDISGKLPHSWPRTFEQIPVNVDRQSDEPGNDAANTDVLYPYGYGLGYQ